MDKTRLNEILHSMANKAALVNISKEDGEYKNMRECPFYSELKGMELVLKMMGIEFDYEFNEDVTKMTAINSQGIRVEI